MDQPLTAAQIAGFRRGFAGAVILPGDAGFEEARRVWNGLHDRRPSLVVQPSSAADVAIAIRFARERGLEVAIRGGSHSASGHGTCDGGLVVDLAAMRGVTVDPERRTATANGGALLSELDREAQAHGLVCPVGVVGHTGVGGLTLGGGMGRLQRRHGLTIDNLRAVELVTADGAIVRASTTEHPELFWGIRGAGANFGVVTVFEFDLQPFDGTLSRGVQLFDAKHVHDIWPIVRDFARSASDDLAVTFAMARAVPEGEYPDSIAGRPMAIVAWNHCGDPADVDRDIEPLGKLPAAAATSGGRHDYVEIQTASDAAMAPGRRSYISGTFIGDLSATTLDALVEHVAQAPGEAGIGVSAFGGAVARVPDDATSFPRRDAPFDLNADGGFWDDPAEDERFGAWCREAVAIVGGDAAGGRYVNEITEAGPDVSRSIYGEPTYARLVALKRSWDPDNVFRSNHNIAP